MQNLPKVRRLQCIVEVFESFLKVKTCFRAARAFISSILYGENIWIAKYIGLKTRKKVQFREAKINIFEKI